MKYRGVGALLLAVPLSAAGVSVSLRRPEKVSANSAPPYWEGASGMGAILAGDRCPVEVEKEHLSFTLGTFPTDMLGGDAETFKNYCGGFTAEYTFFNPTDGPVDLTLVFPLGTLPEYYPYGEELDRASLGYKIKKDGEDVPYTLRHTINGQPDRGGTFDLEEGLSRLYGDRKDFYRDDLPVTVYNYRIEAASREIDFDYTNFAFSFGASAERTRVFCSESCNYSVKNGKAKLTHSFDCVRESPLNFSVYVLGEDISDTETCVFRYERGGAVIDESASITLESREETVFSDFVLSFKGESDMLNGDWENAFIDAIESEKYLRTCCSSFEPQELERPEAFMQWFEYSLSLPAGGRVVNTVSAPIYPTVDEAHSQSLFSYRYLLSPAQKWGKFGQLTIDVDTPYYLSDSSLDFEQREGGYTLTRENLPLGELTFTLSEQERILSGDLNLSFNNDGNVPLIVAIVTLSFVVAGAAVVIVVLSVQSKKRKKRREEEEKRLLQARPQEGKIDLPDEHDGDGTT